jgi:hypothetical protein
MKSTFDNQVVNIAGGSHGSSAGGNRAGSQSETAVLSLKERVAATVKAARAQRELEIQQAADRATAERREIQQKAKAALLSVLADDVINSVIGKHAALGELHTGAIKITKNGVELIRAGGSGASHMQGDRLDLRFDGVILQAGQQLKSLEFQNRVLELQSQGIKIDGVYDTSSQGILITFDYEAALH